jgi:hypothetical protein
MRQWILYSCRYNLIRCVVIPLFHGKITVNFPPSAEGTPLEKGGQGDRGTGGQGDGNS